MNTHSMTKVLNVMQHREHFFLPYYYLQDIYDGGLYLTDRSLEELTACLLASFLFSAMATRAAETRV